MLTRRSSDAVSRPTAIEGCVGSHPLEAAAVRGGWQLVDAYERLGLRDSKKAFGHHLQVCADHARATVENLLPWDGARNLNVYQSDNNRLRFRRTLDFVREGETVFDVGFGRGYLCGLLLRDRRIAAYHGIDVVPSYIDYVGNMLEANGFTDENVHVTIGDLYALDRETVAATGATVAVCCEVLEHVPDPEKALRTLADSLPDNTDLIFSVPLYGRLESVWGHCTVFDTARLKKMCEAAGLYVHHIEPLANTWTFVVASRSPEPSSRVHDMARATVPSRAVPMVREFDFVAVEPSKITSGRWVVRADCRIEQGPGGDVRCVIAGHDPARVEPGGQYGGVAFAVRGLIAVRLRLGLPDAAPVRHIYVDLYNGAKRVARWRWQPEPKKLERGRTRRWSFRFGQDTSLFTYFGPGTRGAHVDRVEAFVEVAPGRTTSFTLGAAYLPGDPAAG